MYNYGYFFLFQAILFYVPRWLWKNWEAGKVAALRMDLNLGIISEVEKKLKKKLLIEYMYSNLKHHNFWAYRYFFCELLSLINVCGKFYAPYPKEKIMCQSSLLEDISPRLLENFTGFLGGNCYILSWKMPLFFLEGITHNVLGVSPAFFWKTSLFCR